jgi:uncharacterized integral membrane protein
VKNIGTTWVERGRPYWTRRVFIALGQLVLLLMVLGLALAGWTWIGDGSIAHSWVLPLRIAAIVAIVAGFVFGLRETLATRVLSLTPEKWRERRLNYRAQHPVLTNPLLNRIVLILFLPVTGPGGFGFMAAFLLGSIFCQELPAERGARLQFEADLRAHGKLR